MGNTEIAILATNKKETIGLSFHSEIVDLTKMEILERGWHFHENGNNNVFHYKKGDRHRIFKKSWEKPPKKQKNSRERAYYSFVGTVIRQYLRPGQVKKIIAQYGGDSHWREITPWVDVLALKGRDIVLLRTGEAHFLALKIGPAAVPQGCEAEWPTDN